MMKDVHGLDVTASASGVDSLEKATMDYYAWSGDPIAVLEKAVSEDEAFALGHSTLATLHMLSFRRGDDPAVTASLKAAEAVSYASTAREQRHLAAAQAWAAGEIARAAEIWEDVLLDYPRDTLAMRFAHDSYIYLGQSQAIRDSVARVLPVWDRSHPSYGFALGAYAFGLEEAGNLREAEVTANKAIGINPDDGWAIHALAHVLETASRQEEGIAFLRAARHNWTKNTALSVHNGWHLALYLLERGAHDQILADYDKHVRPRIAEDAFLDLIDAAALLWRIELNGGNVGDRWRDLSKQLMTHVDDQVLVFNDLHIALAVSRAGDEADLARFRAALDRYESHTSGDNLRVFKDVGRPLLNGILAFAEGEYRRTIELIRPVRYRIVNIGGSHAQRDLVSQTLIAAAERSGDLRLARALLAERVALRPTELTHQHLARVLKVA